MRVTNPGILTHLFEDARQILVLCLADPEKPACNHYPGRHSPKLGDRVTWRITAALRRN